MKLRHDGQQPSWLQNPRQIALWLLLVYLAVAGAYWVAFGKLGCCDQGKWGEFGDFLGGIVNPLIGVFTIWLLARTLIEQEQMVKESRRAVSLEEVQRLLTDASRELGEVMNRDVSQSLSTVHFWNENGHRSPLCHLVPQGQPPSVRIFLDAALRRLQDSEAGWRHVRGMGDFKEMSEIREGLSRIDRCLEAFEKFGGASEIAGLYGDQFRAAALVFHSLHRVGLLRPWNDQTDPDQSDECLRRLGLEGAMRQLIPSISAINESWRVESDNGQRFMLLRDEQREIIGWMEHAVPMGISVWRVYALQPRDDLHAT